MDIEELRDKMFDCMWHKIRLVDKDGKEHIGYAGDYANPEDDPSGKACLNFTDIKNAGKWGWFLEDNIQELEILDSKNYFGVFNRC